MLSRALFLDRDGTIIEDRGYIRDPEKIVLLAGALDGMRRFAAAGWKLVIVSNQSGVARGIIAPEEMTAVHERLLEILAGEGVAITGSYLCQHGRDAGCECRKPGIGSLRSAAAEHGIDLRGSWMVGDRESDILCGNAAGCGTIWMRNAEFEAPAEGVATRVVDGWTGLRPELLERRM